MIVKTSGKFPSERHRELVGQLGAVRARQAVGQRDGAGGEQTQTNEIVLCHRKKGKLFQITFLHNATYVCYKQMFCNVITVTVLY